jgi:hypothetical protein
VTFRVQTPPDTDEGSGVALVLLDEVTGFAFNPRTVPMRHEGARIWSVSVEPPYGALQYYRYELIDPPAQERDSSGTPLAARVVWIQPGLQVDDLVPAWADGPIQAATGSVFGRLTDRGGSPLAEQIVSLAGGWAFTDAAGEFSFRRVPAGLQRLTAFSPDGAYHPAQQGVVVTEGGLTPVQLALDPARSVQVSFEVTVPADTAPGGMPRIAGNLQQLGQRFAEMPGGGRVAAQVTAAMTRVDDTHYLWIAELPAGTHLRYKYTLGDGLWNAERNPEGFFNLREVTIPDGELQLRDTVSSWRGQTGSVLLQATAPENTPAGDRLSIQLNPAAGFAPLPMQRLSERDWFFVLHGPVDLTAPLTYRYCRNLQCASAPEADAGGSPAPVRQVALNARGMGIQDVIEAWAWWGEAGPFGGIAAPEIQPRPELELGVELPSRFHPDWLPEIRQAIVEMRAEGANAVVLRPGWSVELDGGLPSLSFDPSQAPFASELLRLIQAARGSGLTVTLRPQVSFPADDPVGWWAAAPQEDDWWTVWFSTYRSFALRYAQLAEQSGAPRLVLGGPEIVPSLPGSVGEDGHSIAPSDAEGRWRSLLAEVRSVYSGRLALELETGRDLQVVPPFLQEFDEVMLYWHAPLGDRPDLSLTEMRTQARSQLDFLLSQPELSKLPVLLSLAYPSLDGGAGPCAAPAAHECPGPAAAAAGAGEGIILPVDLQEQAWVINAMLLEAHDRPEVRGLFARGYDPLVAVQDEGISVFGKPAGEVLWFWFARLSGAVGN